MKLYLMRHGEAMHPANDPLMRLSPRGRDDVARIAKALRERDVRPKAIWYSPKERAFETAQIVAAELQVIDLQKVQEIQPESRVDAACSRMNKVSENKEGSLLIVSHMPFLPALAGALLGGRSLVPDFETASVLYLESQASGWTRGWALSAREL